MTVPRDEFRNAMARLGAAVNVITSDGQAGLAGFAASAVCSVTDEPPTLLVCVNRNSRSAAPVLANGVLCINVLSGGQRRLAEVFAGMTGASGADRYEGVSYTTQVTGAPALDGAVAAIDCRISEVIEKGTHSVIFAEVQAIKLDTTQHALIYWARDYHPLTAP
jgi:flavin reductase